MKIMEIANEIMDERVLPYVNWNSETAAKKHFMCSFDENNDFGINMIDTTVEDLIDQLNSVSKMIIEGLEQYIKDEVNKFEAAYIVYFFIFHEEAHWLEYLDSGMKPLEYCKSIDLSSYNGELIRLKSKIEHASDEELNAAIMAYMLSFRTTPYEKRADNYALKKLKYLVDNNKI